MKVYVLEAGAYSGRHVVAVFSTKEKAEEVSRKIDGDMYQDEPTVTEYEVDELAEEVRQGMESFYVRMNKSGTANVEKVSLRKPWISYYHGYGCQEDFIAAVVWAKDEAHAVKIVNERRVQAIAEGML